MAVAKFGKDLAMKASSRLLQTTFTVLSGTRSAGYLTGALVWFALAILLAYAFRNAGIFLIIPALIAGKGVSLALRALEPFVNKQPKPDAGAVWLEKRRSTREERRRKPAPDSGHRRTR